MVKLLIQVAMLIDMEHSLLLMLGALDRGFFVVILCEMHQHEVVWGKEVI